ncbi:uncharacterized protein C2orf42 homolog isoform X3 [Xenopus laevis]|uniref:Uncharacterized protein C2orf42 homolog isoform X3 n=1 Tax=Xenopus laevis TaxID=8355 RepID=A0A8J1MN89_XENLA|nr:uncharacterized protein C2orf42 homolog isoform X3 [Xenopus laevis]
MEPSSAKPKVPEFLANLGKATLRGIRKCPRCGTYNGTRGLSCKNKSCGVVFRFGNRKQPSKAAVKLHTGSDVQIFSVRQRDRGHDHRCLVVLGLSETTIQTEEVLKEETVLETDCKMETVVQVQEQPATAFKPKKRRKDDTPGANASVQESSLTPLRKSSPKKHGAIPTIKRPGCSPLIDESQVSLSFQDWLASVTERIHQTMHYQFDGKPEPLVFHIPQSFFDTLQQRISMGNTRKRLPNYTTTFVRKDALPLGTFAKYTWHITNINHVKQIFDTIQVPLEVTRSFVQNRDGTYELFKCPKVEVESIAETYGRIEKQPIRPLELKTFLKVGNTTPDQKEPTPFTIEWIPDILPVSKIGELRIKFEYGHHRNGPATDFHEPPPSLEHTLEITPLTTITFD